MATEAIVSTLELRRLGKLYPSGPWAVRDVDLTVDDGSMLVIAGPSGCGKTTLLRMVAGLEEPTVGEVIIDGDVVNDIRTSERGIALASQHYSLYPHMTVGENIGFPLMVDGLHRRTIDQRVREIARVLQIDEVVDRRPAVLSGGQQQRTAMARALVRRPRLLLLDEPMSNLDAKLRAQTGSFIVGLQRHLGLTTLMVTHDQHEAMAMGDRLVVMRHGRIVQSGRPIDVYDAPANIFVAQFVGTPSMNVVEAQVVEGNGDPALRVGSHVVPLDDGVLRRVPTIRSWVDRTVGLGIRPDAIRRDVDGLLALDVVSTTVVGRDRYIGLDIDAPRIVQHTERVEVRDERSSTIVMSAALDDDVSLWEPCRIGIDTGRIHLFDLSTGDRIT
jgi:multiple sugar transport system ATP-binding protein